MALLIEFYVWRLSIYIAGINLYAFDKVTLDSLWFIMIVTYIDDPVFHFFLRILKKSNLWNRVEFPLGVSDCIFSKIEDSLIFRSAHFDIRRKQSIVNNGDATVGWRSWAYRSESDTSFGRFPITPIFKQPNDFDYIKLCDLEAIAR